MSRKRPRTVSVSLGDRGQTTQDFAVGIGLFLLAMAFVFSYVPTLLTPFSAGGGTGDTAQADRIAATILEDYSTDEANQLNGSEFSDLESEDDLVEEFGLRSNDAGDRIDRVNVTLESLDGEETYEPTIGDNHEDADSTASAGRIVTAPDEAECDPACRLVVRVW
ncbi:DUF7287 family protein [Natrialbaceae archaeon A-gly3]